MKGLLFTITLLFSISPAFGGYKNHQPRCYGLYRGNEITAVEIAEMKEAYGVLPCTILLFWDWEADFDIGPLEGIWKGGAIPMITLEPWYTRNEQGVSLQEISDGRHDKVLERFSAAIQKFAKPVFIRFAHEMNGDWYPWSGVYQGNTGHSYARAYHYVHKFVTGITGTTQTSWIFSPNAENVPDEEWNKPLAYQNKNRIVDALGIDGYSPFNPEPEANFFSRFLSRILNFFFGNSNSFDAIFSEQIDYLQCNFPKTPLLITEIATGLQEPSRSDWLREFFRKMNSSYDFISLFVWFDVKKENDWRINASVSFQEIFRTNVLKTFHGTRNDLIKQFFFNHFFMDSDT